MLNILGSIQEFARVIFESTSVFFDFIQQEIFEGGSNIIYGIKTSENNLTDNL